MQFLKECSSVTPCRGLKFMNQKKASFDFGKKWHWPLLEVKIIQYMQLQIVFECFVWNTGSPV